MHASTAPPRGAMLMRAVHYSADRRMTIPLTVISGPAGAGKSALLRHMMETTSGRRIVAVTRDLSPLLDDSPAAVRRDGARAVWPTGCSAIESADATATLTALARGDLRAEHVIVEADGSRNPRRVTGYGYMPGYRPDGVVMVVDASVVNEVLPEQTFDTAMCSQLRSADVVVLNKLDLAGVDTTATAQRSLIPLAPAARFLWCRRGQIAPELLLGAASATTTTDDLAVVAEWRPDYVPVRTRERKTPIGEHAQAWCLLADGPIDARDFRSWVARLPQSILRGAGTVHLSEEPQHRHDFSLIGSRWALPRGTPWGHDAPSTRITLVGVGARHRGPNQSETAAESDEGSAGDDLSRMVM